jgi:AcrR family transcriptional regulator
MKTRSPRVQQNREATIKAILETARLIMREEGVAALSMQELARRMDMRAPSLYNYFSSKMEIYDALFCLGFTLFDEHTEKLLKNAGNLHDTLRAYIEGYMSFAMENPELYQLCFERPVPGFVPSEASLAISLGLLDRSRRRVKELKKRLDTRLSSEQIVNLLIAVSHGLTAMHLANEPHLPVGQGRFSSLIPATVAMLEQILPPKGVRK